MSFLRPLKSATGTGVERFFELSLLFCVLSSQLALILTRQLHPLHCFIMVAFLGAGFVCRPRLSSCPAYVWNALISGVLLLNVANALMPPRDFESYFRSIAYFLVYVLLVRYATRKSLRDDLIVMLLALLQLCAASIMTISLVFMFSLVIFMVSITSSLMLFVLRSEHALVISGRRRPENERGTPAPGQTPQEGAPPQFNIPPRFFRFSVVTSLAILLLGFAVFFVIPRAGSGLFGLRSSMHSRVPGFSDTVELGSVGRTLRRDSLAMRVKLPEGELEGSPLYMRGNALDHYDGNSWTDTLGYKSLRRYSYQSPVTISTEGTLTESVRQEIILEPTDSTVLFAIPVVKALLAPFKYRAVLEYWNDYVGIAKRGPLYDRVAYTAWSVPQKTIDECGKAGPGEALPGWLRRRYLQMPPGSGEITELAMEVAEGYRTQCGKAAAVRDHLLRSYTYDINTPSDLADNPLRHFLFISERGYCEHFASSAALMLRALGVPCRLAAGYAGAYFNPVQNYYMVREYNAHTWVEVFARGEWLRMDPTPARTEQDKAAWTRWFQDVYDSFRFQWDRWVVNLSLTDQYRLARSASRRGSMAGRWLIRMPEQVLGSVRSMAGSYPAALAGVVLLILIVYLLRSWGVIAPKEPAADRSMTRLRKSYARLLARAARRGFARKPSETPLELCRRIGPEGVSAAFHQATVLYLQVRFGNSGDAEKAMSKIKEAQKLLSRKLTGMRTS